jgi:hypothetical protein
MENQGLKSLLVGLFLLSFIGIATAEESKLQKECLQKAIKRIEIIRMLPEKKYLQTLDGQQVELREFFVQCSKNWPHCDLYPKFYYWNSEVKIIKSRSSSGYKKHKIRMYCNCLSYFCTNTVKPEKTHGDVAECYDENGAFMGLSVYMGLGQYFSLPYSGNKE